MDDDTPREPLFRANKRRRVFRKRAHSDELDAAAEALSDPTARVVGTDALYYEEANNGSTGIVRFQKKTGAKKAGIAFTSSDATRNGEEENEERATVVAEDDGVPAAIQGADRFVKPTGKVAVADNKHMVAYVDSKLAEMRSAISTPVNEANYQGSEDSISEAQTVINRPERGSTASVVPTAKTPTTFDSAQSRSTSVYQRPTKRKKPPQREQKDVARDSIIDQIMQESQVPLYDRSGSHTPLDNVDNGAATAEAFKAQLLVEMEEQNRRRPAPRNPAVKDGTASMQSGPKLGGSRAQREKMRALEEAKTKGSSAKK